MHIKLRLTICQAGSRQPLGRSDGFQSRMRHQSLSPGDWLFVCAAMAPSVVVVRRLADCSPGLSSFIVAIWHHVIHPRCRAGKCLFTLRRAQPPHVQYHLGVLLLNWLVCPSERGRFSSLVMESLAALVHLFQDGLDGGLLFVLLARPSSGPRSYDRWLTSGSDVVLCPSICWHLRWKAVELQ